MSLNIVERHQLILKKLKEQGSINAIDLSKEFKVSTVTIRKDLKLLEDKQLLYRSHGKAILNNPYITGRTINEKEKISIKEKRSIASEATLFIEPNDNIIIASGTTLIEFSRHITEVIGLSVITASLNAALIVSKIPNVEVIQLGGILRPSSSSVIGPLTEKILADFVCNKLFLGVDGFDIDYGLTTTNTMEASLNKIMIQSAEKIIVLVDSSKFEKKGFGRICGIEDIDIVITDNGINKKIKHQLIEHGIEVRIVS